MNRGTWLFTREGDLDLGWVLTVFVLIVGTFWGTVELFTNRAISQAAWAWLGSVTAALLGASAWMGWGRTRARAGMAAGPSANPIPVATTDGDQHE